MLTVSDVCRRLGQSKYTVYRLIHEGRLPAVRVEGQRHKYLVEENVLEDYLESQDYFATPVAEHDGPVLLTAAEVAAILRCSVETVRRLASSPESSLSGIRNPGVNSHWRFDRDAVLDYLRARPAVPSISI